MSVPSDKLAGAMRTVKYGRVRRPGDELRPGSPSFHTEVTSLADLEREVRRQCSMPKSGPMFYKANGYWRDIAEPADLPEDSPLHVKMVVVKKPGYEDENPEYPVGTIWLEKVLYWMSYKLSVYEEYLAAERKKAWARGWDLGKDPPDSKSTLQTTKKKA